MRNRAAAVAGVTIVCFVLLLVYAALNLVRVQRELQQELGESNLWIATQGEREAQQFLLALSGAFSEQADNDPDLRFEILYSRVALISEGPQTDYFRSIGANELLIHANALMQELEPLVTQPRRSPAETQTLFRKANDLAATFRELSNKAGLNEREDQLGRRAAQGAATRLLLVAIFGVFITGAIMAGLLLRNIHCLTRTQATLERHQATLEETIAERTRELREAVAVERRAREVYRSFIVILSHQFRTPVSIIHMIAQRQLRSLAVDTSETLHRKFTRIYEAAERLERLLGCFLDAASMEQQQIVLSPGRIDLNCITRAAVEHMADRHPDRQIDLQLQDGPLPLDGDAGLLEQVLMNLLSNALDYSSAPAPVTVTTARVRGHLTCTVTDHGIGIPATAQAAIFEKFYRAPNVHRLPGVGVGLHLARTIVSLHGGSVSFTSQEGVGSTFTLALPEAGGQESHEQHPPDGDHPLHRG